MSEQERILLQRLEEENALRKKLMGFNPLGMVPVSLPGETAPRPINFGDNLEEEYEELNAYPQEQLREPASGWLVGKDGRLHMTVILPGEKMGAAFGAHMSHHEKDKEKHGHRLNAAMIQVTPNPLGGAPNVVYNPSIEQGYGTPNGPFRMNTFQDANGAVTSVYGARAINDLFRASSELSSRKIVMGCPIVHHEDVEGRISHKKARYSGTIAHIKKMKGSFAPLSYNQGSLENPSMMYLKSPSAGMSEADAAAHLVSNVPGVTPEMASNIMAGIRNQYTARFGNAIPAGATFTVHESELYHPTSAYVVPGGQFEHLAAKDANGKDVPFALEDKQSYRFGAGFAYRYGAPGHKHHIFQNVYTTLSPQGAPIGDRPVLSTSWYPSASDPEAYIVQPSHAPYLQPQIAISTPIGNTGQAFLV